MMLLDIDALFFISAINTHWLWVMMLLSNITFHIADDFANITDECHDDAIFLIFALMQDSQTIEYEMVSIVNIYKI